MTLAKGYTKISLSKANDARLMKIKCRMIAEEPEKYDETTSYNTLVSWMIDRVENDL